MYNNRYYLIFNVSELSLVDFSEVLETSGLTVRKSIDGYKTFIKWEGATPSFIDSITSKQGPFSHGEITEILSGTSWTPPIDEKNYLINDK